ncbi:MAG: hypothetical protein JWP88_1397, partial [Flaviaesturariibacter sp.]|nr:hypothetical protein [Flaviaesturariibacter sp.]
MEKLNANAKATACQTDSTLKNEMSIITK